MRINTSWAFAGNSVYAGCQWMVFILLVKSLPLADVGHFAYAVALTGPIFILANVRLRNLLATGIQAPNDFADYFAARLLTTSAALGASLIVGMVAAPALGSLGIVALIACARACDAVSDICHGLFQREFDMRSAAIGLMVNGVLSVTLVGLSLAVSPSLGPAAAAYALGSCTALAAWDLPRTARHSQVRRWSTIVGGTFAAPWRLIVTALPLGLSAALGSLQTNLPRYVVAAYLGPASLAVFAALSYIPTLGNLVVNATAQAALPVLARDLRTSPRRYRRRLMELVAAGVALGAGTVLCTAVLGHPVLAWVYSAEYASHAGVLLWLMAAGAVSYAFVFLGTASTARRRFGAQLLISSAGLAVVACCVVPLVAGYGLPGAAVALLAGAVVEGCAYVALTVHDLRIAEPLPRVVAGALAEGIGS